MIKLTSDLVTKVILPSAAAVCTLVASMINNHTEKLRVENLVDKKVDEKIKEMQKQQEES